MAVVPECLLIDQDVAHLVSLSVEQEPPSISLVMSATPLSAICPLCSQSSCRVHSTYTRTLADVSWACVPVRFTCAFGVSFATHQTAHVGFLPSGDQQSCSPTRVEQLGFPPFSNRSDLH